MQQNSKTHFRHRSKFSQLILLDDQAIIESSCDSIFDTANIKNTPITQHFPFLESIFSNIWNILGSQSAVTFNKIETGFPQLPGFYDYTFSKVEIDGKRLILWSIYDYTDIYEDLKQFQQRKNELEIHREQLERRHQLLKNKSDVKIQQNIIVESLDHIQLTYFNKIKAALISPINALDGFTFILTQALEHKTQHYTQQLRTALKQLHLILDDLETESNAIDNKDTIIFKDLFNRLKKHYSNKKVPINISIDADAELPNQVYGNVIYLQQIIMGIIGNAVNFHTNSTFDLIVSTKANNNESVCIYFQIIEKLNTSFNVYSEIDYTNLIYRLSVIKQLIELQKGNISVIKDPKNLSITICFDLEYARL